MSWQTELSFTKLSMYLRCPRQFAFRYEEGLKLPPSGAMKRGLVGHALIEENYRQKAITRKDLPLDEIGDRFAAEWRLGLQKEEVIFDKDETPDQVRDQGIAAVTAHRTVIAPRVMPAAAEAVEEPFHIMLPVRNKDGEQYSLRGKKDLTDNHGIIRDNKIMGANRRVSALDIAQDLQLSIYAIAHRIQHQQPESGVSLDVVRLLKHPVALSISGARTRDKLKDEFNNIGHVARGIDARVFPKNTNGWWCSEKWCGYWHRCEGKNLKLADLGTNLEKQLKESIDAVQGK